jgi:hypothetical protein
MMMKKWGGTTIRVTFLKKLSRSPPSYSLERHLRVIGDKGFRGWTRFTLAQINEAFERIEPFTEQKGSGRRCDIAPKSRFALFLHMMAHDPSLEMMAVELMPICRVSRSVSVTMLEHIFDRVFFTAQYGISLPVLFDGGFQGVGSLIPGCVLPRPKPASRELSPEDREFNQRLSHDGIIVENFYGRPRPLKRAPSPVEAGARRSCGGWRRTCTGAASRTR